MEYSEVVIRDIEMKFGSMVVFMIKFWLASFVASFIWLGPILFLYLVIYYT